MKIIEHTYKWNGTLATRPATKNIVMHHAEAVHCTVDDIHTWHLQNGWVGIGYHLFVTKTGDVIRCRPIDAEGAHTLGGYNDNSIGICHEGNFEIEVMGEAQSKASIEAIRYVRSLYHGLKVFRHCDLNNTKCPGANFRNQIIFEGMMDVEVKDVNAAVAVLVEKGVVSGPDYWVKAASVVNFLDKLLIKMANKLLE